MLILLCKIISKISLILNLGNGSTWPGHIALKLNPKILRSLESNLKFGSIVIAGTNGKTTTSKLIREVLEKKYKVVQNASGANLLNGITSALITNSGQIGIFEVDENTLPLLVNSFTPKIIVILNLFRDQLDRYGEVNTIAIKWKRALENLPGSTTVILNADDPQIAFLGQNLKAKVIYFGLDNPKLFLKTAEHATDSTYCPNCSEKLIYKGIYYSHIGEWSCPKCHYARPKFTSLSIRSPLPGTYNLYNTLASQVVLNELGFHNFNFADFQPAFGRQEKIIINNKKIIILLSKNPTGFNQSIRTLDEFSKEKKTVMLVLNDRIPDGRDISWIWDVDFENLKDNVKKIYISGERCFDMGLRIKYSDIKNYEIYENLKTCISKALSETDMLYILPTYSAMLEVRKILSGKKIL